MGDRVPWGVPAGSGGSGIRVGKGDEVDPTFSPVTACGQLQATLAQLQSTLEGENVSKTMMVEVGANETVGEAVAGGGNTFIGGQVSPSFFLSFQGNSAIP